MTRATIKSGTANILNTIIGAGILAMPYGLRQNGLLFGSILIAWSACTSAFGLYLQNKVARYTGQRGSVSYFSLAQVTYPQLSIVFDTAISIKCFGVGVSYLVVIGDLMPKIMESLEVSPDSFLMGRNFWITVIMATVVAPLSFLKKLSSLRNTSILSLFSIAYLICLVIGNYAARAAAEGNHSGTVIPIPAKQTDWIGPISWERTLSSFPMFVFSYTCHQNMFAIINELQPDEKDGSQTRQSNFIIWNALLTASASYLLVAVFGYLTFGRQVSADIITMYSPNSISTLIGNLSIVIMSSLSFPLQCHPCRGSVNHVIYFIKKGVKNSKLRKELARQRHYGCIEGGDLSAAASDVESLNSFSGANNLESSIISTTPMEGAHDTLGHAPIIVPLSTRRFYIITTVIVILAYLVALSVTSLAMVLAFVGSLGSTSIAFILPGLFGYLLMKPLEPRTKLNNLERFCKYGGLALAIWGFVVMVTCLTATIFQGA
ncbi:uncharacterized protein LODBEIA_P31940 [Lodderomyces beijingensis]|uniref:Amino acid transporter transmembrane domain-containing protein n=1 Tax=Lodderomyces beijingensis TaxID=1775926 RepID=A0ABP0ZRY8_9ASCO